MYSVKQTDKKTDRLYRMIAKRVTLKEVAQEAGVSMITASNIISGKRLDHASPATRHRVQEAARRLGYRPNLAARQLASRKNDVIGMLIDSESPIFYRDVLRELERLANAKGWRLQIGIVHNDLNSIRQYVNDFLGNQISYVVCATHNYPDFGAEIPAMFEPFRNVVFLEEPLCPTRFPVVASDHNANYFHAAKGLIARGRKRIICCARTISYRDPSFFKAEKGFKAAYAGAGVPFEEGFWFVKPEPFDKHFAELLDLKPDALIVANEKIMFKALKQLKKAHLRVPHDIALFSAELSVFAELADPAFSGFSYNAEELAVQIMKHLPLSSDDLPDRSPVEYIRANLVWSESTESNRINHTERKKHAGKI